jgi:acetoacetyl-[acyl-carrier protein] synthase
VSILPVIVGFGGIGPAGRSSFHHAFQRLVYDALPLPERAKVVRSLGRMMGLPAELPAPEAEKTVLDRTLIRRIEPQCFDTERLYRHQKIDALPRGGALGWTMSESDLPTTLPSEWQVTRRGDGQVDVTVTDRTTFFVPDHTSYTVRAGGMLLTGFNLGSKYPSKNHPRGLQMAIYGASDAVRSVGIEWRDLLARVPGDRIAVYASSAMGQLDWEGAGGMLRASLLGKHTTSRNCPFGLPQMPADFINAYVIGSIGRTAGLIGACATFLYNLEKAVRDLQDGVVQLAVVGAAEAPLNPEVLEGYRAMSALAEDPELLELDGLTAGEPDHRRACRPFGENCGFTMGESGQYVVLMSDELALAEGATIYGAVPGVYVHADGTKTSISSPGIGNYLTLGKACSLGAKILGDEGLRRHTLLHAHGTSTPQNRVTESHVFDRVAAAFDIRDWVVAATKCYVGHSLGAASGDQTIFALGSLAMGLVPGIATVREFASDVHGERLALSNQHREYPADHWQGALINSKGFGGNNATGLLLSRTMAERIIARQHGSEALAAHARRNEAVRARQQSYEQALLEGQDQAIYQFGGNVMDGSQVTVERGEIRIPSFPLPVSLDVDNPYGRAT